MKINPLIFRAYDIRGIYGKDLNEEVFQKIGFVLGKKKEKFLVGNDIRKSGELLAKALIQGLQAAKAKVIYSGINSFGLCLFSGLKLKVDKTLFITASHLPSEWNGLKIYFGDGEPFSKIEKIGEEVIKIQEKKIKFQKPKIEKVNFKNEYFDFLLKKFPLLKNNNLKIVIDCGNGSMGLVAPQIFKNFGFEVIQEIQPKIKHMAYPIKKENIGKFGTFYFYGQKDKIEDFKNKIKSIDRILRFVILKRKSFKINSK